MGKSDDPVCGVGAGGLRRESSLRNTGKSSVLTWPEAFKPLVCGQNNQPHLNLNASR